MELFLLEVTLFCILQLYMSTHKQRIIIVGGGFAGIRVAKDLNRQLDTAQHEIILISNNDYFEYYPAMYRVVTGSSPIRVQIPLADIFEGTDVTCICDTIVDIDVTTKTVRGINDVVYTGDTLVLALGAQINYFNIEGLEEVSFNFKSVDKALHLRSHIHRLFASYNEEDTEAALVALNFVIVGAGPSGVELAGEMALYTKALAKKYDVPESLISVNLVQASGRVLPTFPERVSARALKRLRSLGVNVLLNRILIQGRSWTALLKDMKMGTRTIVWTAGVKTNEVYRTLAADFEFDGKGRVVVDEYMQARGHAGIYIAGDNAATEYSGLAQTALYDGAFIADDITRRIKGKVPRAYTAKEVAFDVPIGPGWAALVVKGSSFFGRIPWILRHLIDFKFYVSILPFRKAWHAFFAPTTLIDHEHEE